jgi:hypothetical protein
MEGRRRRLAAVAAGVVLGAAAFGAVRFAALPPEDQVHYHANWALWIDGSRVDLSGNEYMEAVTACAVDASQMTGEARVHMHGNNPDVIHVHHDGATWAHLLQNLGWGIGYGWIVTRDGTILREEGGAQLNYVLNGLVVPPVHDRVIRPGDRLLISFGPETPATLLAERFPTVAENAPEYDLTSDPAGCAGTVEETLGERLRRAFWF